VVGIRLHRAEEEGWGKAASTRRCQSEVGEGGEGEWKTRRKGGKLTSKDFRRREQEGVVKKERGGNGVTGGGASGRNLLVMGLNGG